MLKGKMNILALEDAINQSMITMPGNEAYDQEIKKTAVERSRITMALEESGGKKKHLNIMMDHNLMLLLKTSKEYQFINPTIAARNHNKHV